MNIQKTLDQVEGIATFGMWLLILWLGSENPDKEFPLLGIYWLGSILTSGILLFTLVFPGLSEEEKYAYLLNNRTKLVVLTTVLLIGLPAIVIGPWVSVAAFAGAVVVQYPFKKLQGWLVWREENRRLPSEI